MTTKFDIGQKVWFLNGMKKPKQEEVMEIIIRKNKNIYYRIKGYESELLRENELADSEYDLFKGIFFGTNPV